MRRPLRLSLNALALVATPASAATDLWWDSGYGSRLSIAITAGANPPDRGLAGYTVRIPGFDTASLIAAGEMRGDCNDLRIAWYDGLAWQDLPRHVIGCNSAQTDIRFALSADILPAALDDDYYLYYDNAAPGTPPAMNESNVYLWYDDATQDRSGSYVRGRTDNWHGSGWDDTLAWNPAGYYDYDNGDNFTSGYMRPVDERDVYVEAEFFHTGCYQLNITTGLLIRGIAEGGGGSPASSNHYFASNRGEFPGCTVNGYTHDGDIVARNRQQTVVDGPNPPDVVPNVWRRQALAGWLTAPTRLAFWDEDQSAAWAAAGFPSGANLQVAGSSNETVVSRGFAGVMTAQDRARVRNILIRRYVEPEPRVALVEERQPAALRLEKNLLTVYDPVNDASNPKAIPGSWVEYTITARNTGPGYADDDSVIVTDSLPANVALFVGDLAGPGAGPIDFTDGAGGAASGLSLVFGGLGDTGDDVDFSLDGADWTYVPVADGQGFDSRVRHVRVRPSGRFAGATGAIDRTFELRFRVRLQ